MSFERYYGWFGHGEPPSSPDVLICWVPSVSPEVLPPERVTIGPVIATSHRVLLMSENHRLARRATVDVEELADHEVLYPAAMTNIRFVDAWCPPTTPGGRAIHRRKVSFAFPEQLNAALADDLVHITAADVYWPVLGYLGLTSVALTGLPPLLLATTADSDMIRSFAASTARRPD
jgi:hypothetical protein